MLKKSKNDNQKGGVSLFIVIFACLMVTIITVSFVSLMVRNQEQATNTDLSSSAYDSAMAGVEDAKRLAIVYRDCKAAGDTTSQKCSDAITGVEAKDCNSIQTGLNNSTSTAEVKIKSSDSDTASDALNQAYTCVKVNYYTNDIKRQIRDGETQMVPLKAKDGASFNRVKISWHKRPQGTTGNMTIPTSISLPQKSSWGTNPAVLRTQFLQTDSTFTLDQFNSSSATESNTNTVFLYPYTAGTSVSFSASDPRPNTNPRAPVTIACSNALYTGGDYACSATINLPSPVGGSAASRKNSFLVLSSIYNATDYKVELLDSSGDPVPFDGVQPAVDATGRANDLFRRVDARIEFDAGSFNYPTAALDINGDLCKAFAVTDKTATYSDGGCTP